MHRAGWWLSDGARKEWKRTTVGWQWIYICIYTRQWEDRNFAARNFTEQPRGCERDILASFSEPPRAFTLLILRSKNIWNVYRPSWFLPGEMEIPSRVCSFFLVIVSRQERKGVLIFLKKKKKEKVVSFCYCGSERDVCCWIFWRGYRLSKNIILFYSLWKCFIWRYLVNISLMFGRRDSNRLE